MGLSSFGILDDKEVSLHVSYKRLEVDNAYHCGRGQRFHRSQRFQKVCCVNADSALYGDVEGLQCLGSEESCIQEGKKRFFQCDGPKLRLRECDLLFELLDLTLPFRGAGKYLEIEDFVNLVGVFMFSTDTDTKSGRVSIEPPVTRLDLQDVRGEQEEEQEQD